MASDEGIPLRTDGQCAAKHHASALETIADAVSRAEAPYVSVSGGKDSMLMAQLAIEVDPSIPMIHSTHGARGLPPQWPGILVDALRSMGATEIHTTPDNLIWTDTGHDLVMVGLRRAESRRRRERMDTVERLDERVEECWPIADWADRHVWACHIAHDIPRLNLYTRGWRRVHWPETPIQRSEWSRVAYVGGPSVVYPGAPEWLGSDPEFGDFCRGCGRGIADPVSSRHEEGCVAV